jgi:hypothetical protein
MMLLLALLASTALASDGWQKEKAISLESGATKSGKLGPNPPADYVTVDLSFAPFQAARIELEARVGVVIKNRGEAHLTVISPPEFKILSRVLAPKKIRDLVSLNFDFAKLGLRPLCLGQGTAAADKTWFVVMEAKSAVQARRAIEVEFLKQGGEKFAFKAAEFYPHVTLGFTKRDLHLQDGVLKDVTSCKFPIRR